MASRKLKYARKRKSQSVSSISDKSSKDSRLFSLSVSRSTIDSNSASKNNLENKASGILYYLKRLKSIYWDSSREKSSIDENVRGLTDSGPSGPSSTAEEIVSAAIEYGVTHGIVCKDGKYFWLSGGRLARRSVTPGVALRKTSTQSKHSSVDSNYTASKKGSNEHHDLPLKLHSSIPSSSKSITKVFSRKVKGEKVREASSDRKSYAPKRYKTRSRCSSVSLSGEESSASMSNKSVKGKASKKRKLAIESSRDRSRSCSNNQNLRKKSRCETPNKSNNKDSNITDSTKNVKRAEHSKSSPVSKKRSKTKFEGGK